MRASHIQVIGEELAIRWENGGETYMLLEAVRRRCPCAGCQGETDVMGQVSKPAQKPFTAASFRLKSWNMIGGYGIQPTWEDGHGTGIYSFDYLHRLGETTPSL